jgi:hypothetical protein
MKAPLLVSVIRHRFSEEQLKNNRRFPKQHYLSWLVQFLRPHKMSHGWRF